MADGTRRTQRVIKLIQKLSGSLMDEFEEISRNPEGAQERVLRSILRENRNTEYGQDQGFRRINSIPKFQRAMPVVEYEDIESRIERMKLGETNILCARDHVFFSTTSGSTNTPKFIPITNRRFGAFKEEYTIWLNFALRETPEMLNGKLLALTGRSLDGRTEGGIPYGTIVGYISSKSPWYARRRMVVPPDVCNIKDFDKKMHTLARAGLEADVSQLALSSPIEVLLLFDHIQKNRDRLIKEIFNGGNRQRGRELAALAEFTPSNYWPNLKVLNYIKGGFARFYLDRVQEFVGPEVSIRDPGIYSSEGRVSICLSDQGAKGVIAAGSNFFEFMEMDDGNMGDPITLGEVESGKEYSVLMTTQEGLYRYDIGDIVRVVDFYENLPVVEFVDRRNRGFSIADEYTTESVLVSSVKKASERQRIPLVSFTVVPNVDATTPRYEFMIEPSSPLDETRARDLLRCIDDELKTRNPVYRRMQQELGRIGSPAISIVKPGSYNALDRARIEDQGVRQIKPVNLSMDPDFKDNFEIEATYSL
ncbi:MAG: GH3 auxin-responsive promoter family protein [archaeon]